MPLEDHAFQFHAPFPGKTPEQPRRLEVKTPLNNRCLEVNTALNPNFSELNFFILNDFYHLNQHSRRFLSGPAALSAVEPA